MKITDNLIKSAICPICESEKIKKVITINQLPIHCHLLWPTRSEAVQVPRGDIQLGYCAQCGHIFNYDFELQLMDYTQTYENSLHFSPTFQDYAKTLVDRLVNQYDLYQKKIVEIGCGHGEFLLLICKTGNNQGYGFDPSYSPSDEHSQLPDNVKFVRDYFSEKYHHIRADLVISRHVLEHIPKPRTFLTELTAPISHATTGRVFLEVPNALFTLRDLGVWDIIYEHCSYFSDISLSYLLQKSGLFVHDSYETYHGQFLCMVAEKGAKEKSGGNSKHRSHLHQLNELVNSFAVSYINKVNTWRTNLSQLAMEKRRIVLWGSGSKGITFLNTLGITEQIEFVVDINPRKHNKFVTGTGQQIVPPEFLLDYRPEIVIILNPIYKHEIERKLFQLGVDAKILQV